MPVMGALLSEGLPGGRAVSASCPPVYAYAITGLGANVKGRHPDYKLKRSPAGTRQIDH